MEYPKPERKEQKVGLVGTVESEDYTEDDTDLVNTELPLTVAIITRIFKMIENSVTRMCL